MQKLAFIVTFQAKTKNGRTLNMITTLRTNLGRIRERERQEEESASVGMKCDSFQTYPSSVCNGNDTLL